ncbi:ClpP/crotonase [Mytilinidion resinicola]|uniref:ClpP/crotonase n=1 Tax=Mytilinidion resinicola TaxID=574789 RepID=A0A6A6YB98_9PEZI|nr:ClpP/crotonase [Mytilinidion resinicola]KAF2806091.1 ClpP/crotonase [Mytilinidion resinicola]
MPDLNRPSLASMASVVQVKLYPLHNQLSYCTCSQYDDGTSNPRRIPQGWHRQNYLEPPQGHEWNQRRPAPRARQGTARPSKKSRHRIGRRRRPIILRRRRLELREAFHGLQDITRLTSSSRAIIIAAVHGFAIGGGAEIALAADFVIGGPGARFRFPGVMLGYAVTGGISLRLVRLVGLLKAKELLLTDRWVDADEALKLGMVNEVSDEPKQRAM